MSEIEQIRTILPHYIPITTFAENFYVLPTTRQPIQLYPHQKKILSLALTPDPTTGKLKYKTVVYSCPKKSGKTEIAALIAAWFATCISPDTDEILVCANDLEQAAGRVYKSIKLAFEKNKYLSKGATIQLKNVITNRGVEIKAISSDYAGAAGANMGLTTWDELWGYQSEGCRVLYEELTPVPTRHNSIRVITTYAGIMGESELLENVYNTGLKGLCVDEDLNIWINDRASLFMYWDHNPRMPWQDEKYYLDAINEPGFRQSAFDRIHRNMWVTGEEAFPMDDWYACQSDEWKMIDAEKPDKKVFLALGVDASEVKDRAAVTSVFRLGNKIFLGPRKWWQPSKENPLDLENTIEAFIMQLRKNYNISAVYYDKYQFLRSAQTLERQGVNMVEYPQTRQNGVVMCTVLMDLLRYKNLVLYDDPELTAEASMASLKEVPGDRTGFRIVKNNRDKKIDSIIALAMACVAAQNIPESNRDFTDTFMFLR